MQKLLLSLMPVLFLSIARAQVDSKTVKIGSQTWMLRNLDVSTYSDGSPIPEVTDNAAWKALTTGAYCYYNNDSATYAATYGKLYNWYAVNDPRGLAPKGFHLPSDSEYAVLSKFLGGDLEAANKMKETGITHWKSPNKGATNVSGFTGLPGGKREANGTFSSIGFEANWWSSTEFNKIIARFRNLVVNDGGLFKDNSAKQKGFSIRCVKD